MKRVVLLFMIVSLCTGSTAYAQKGKQAPMDSDVALGLRATPDGGGFTGKFFVSRNVALEAQLNAGGIMGLEGESFNAVLLAEYHIAMPDPSWRIFFGGGLHAGAWDRGYYYSDYRGRWVNDAQPIFGIDGIGGVEYVFKNIPLGLSADIKPAINFVSDVDFFPHNMFGASARFYLGR